MNNLTTKWLVVLGLGVVGLDQASKWLASSAALVVLNPGISFSLAENSLSQAQIIGGVVAALIVVSLLAKKWWRYHRALWVMVAAGAGSNLFDRFRLGGVQDWLSVPGLPWRNNLADIVIVASLGWIAWQIMIDTKEKNDSA